MKYTLLNVRPYEVHSLVLNSVEPDSTALELGCASGYFSEALSNKGLSVVGVEYEKEAAKKAEKWCKKVIVADLEESANIAIKEKFDYVLLMDVIEHLKNRDALLMRIKEWLSMNGELILTTPNIAHISIRLKLLFGDFTYTKMGILDETHTHFYTRSTLLEELQNKGYATKECVASADFGQIPFVGRFLRHLPKSIQFSITKMFPTLLGVQWMVIATKK